MSANPAPSKFKPFTPEERASFLAYRFGSTLDWATQILVKIGYPVEEIRWFVDAVLGVCKGKPRRIAHATLANRARRFKNVDQAKKLVKSAIEVNNAWSRDKRIIVIEHEPPKPHEREGKEKRARALYTDYLTAPAVWAQEEEARAKKKDEVRWRRDSKHRFVERQRILEAAVRQLPGFASFEDMPDSVREKEPKPLELGEYIQQRKDILLAENRRVLDKLTDGDLVDVDEIDDRIAKLEVFYGHIKDEVKKSFESARDVLEGLRNTRCVRAMDVSDPLEAVAEFDKQMETKGEVELPLSQPENEPAAWLKECAESPDAEAAAPPIAPLCGYNSLKGDEPAFEPEPPPEGFEDLPIEDFSTEPPAELSQLDCALRYAEQLGWPVFPCKPNKAPYTARGFKEATTDPAQIRSWWQKWPDAGIGIPTGKASGLLVLDVDPRHGGDASLSALVEEYGDLPATAHALTPSMGDHFAFKCPSSAEIGNSAGKLGKGLDIRGEGGYIVAPGRDPSRRWTNALEPAEPPAWMIVRLLSEKIQPIDTDRKVLHFSGGPGRFFADGERNNGLRDVALGRWANGYAEDVNDLYQQLRQVRDTRCAAGKDAPATDAQLWNLAQRTAEKFARGERRATT